MMNERVRVTKRATFEAAHYLPEYDGDCGRLHGHSYKLEVTVSGTIDSSTSSCASDGMVIDFKSLSAAIKEVIRNYDHHNLNDFLNVPTAECIAITIYHELETRLNFKDGTKLESVRLWETEDSYAEFRGEEE